MTVIDHEKGGDIINPFILIEGKDNNGRELGGTCLNTSTFRYAQEKIIHPLEWMRLDKNPQDGYSIWAMIGEYNGNPDLGQISSSFLHSVSVVREPRAKILLGYLERELVEKNFPNTKEYFDSARKDF